MTWTDMERERERERGGGYDMDMTWIPQRGLSL